MQVIIGVKASGRAAWLLAGAAASYARMRAAGMPAGGITDAGRTYDEQAALYAAYLAGQLVAFAARPGTSKHESGRALDLATAHRAHAWMLAHGAAHGWHRPIKAEPWHWEYDVTRDRHLTDPAGPVAGIEEEDDMDAQQAQQLIDTVNALGRIESRLGPDVQQKLDTILQWTGDVRAGVGGLPALIAAIDDADQADPAAIAAELAARLGTDLAARVADRLTLTVKGA